MKGLETKTNATFTSANGKTIRFEEIFEGIRTNVEIYGRKGGSRMSEDDLKDIYQDAALKAVKACGRYDSQKSKPNTWASVISDRCEKDAFKKGQRDGVTFTEYQIGEDDEEVPYGLCGYRGDEFEADAELSSNEAVSFIWASVDGLRDNYGDVLRLTAEGYEAEEIAEELGCKVEDVYRWLNRARKVLRKSLGNDFLKKCGMCA